MILTCPECSTRYQTDAALFTPDGRKVRCAKCGHVWFQGAPEPDGDFEAPAEKAAPAIAAETPTRPHSAYAPSPIGSAADRGAPAPARRLEWVGLAVGWAALAAILVTIGWSAVRFRQDIASLWPQSSSLYAALGLPVNARGIAFTDVTYRRESDDGQAVLAVSGNLVNISTHELSVPAVRVALIDDDRRELYHWNFTPNVVTLRPGQIAPFLTRLPSPPAGARHIEIRFAEHGN
jgi:predicted Zn finger-like uncharacterized protein